MTLQNCFLITGAPLTGKSTLAKEVARKMNATVLSTDVIRDWMQNLFEPQDSSDLFFGKGVSVQDIHAKFPTAKELLDAQLRQNKAVEKGVVALLQTRYLDWDTLVLEGIVLSPAFICNLIQEFKSISFDVTVLLHNQTSITERLKARQLWEGKTMQISETNVIEVDWISLYDDLFKKEANKYELEVRYI